MIEVTLECASGGNRTRMRRLTIMVVTILTSLAPPALAPPALAAGVPTPTGDSEDDLNPAGPAPADEPASAPAVDPVAELQPLQHRSVRRHERTEERRRERAADRRRSAAAAAAVPPHLEVIAQCESGGDPTAIGGGGQFRGKYQFTYETWAAVGGSGDPAQAPEGEQDRRAAILYETSGPGQWPVCGQ